MSDKCSSDAVELTFVIAESDAGKRLDVLLTEKLKATAEQTGGAIAVAEVVPTRAKISRWIAESRVHADEQPATRPAAAYPPGTCLRISVPRQKAQQLEADGSIPLDIVFEDEHILVLNKDAGTIVHPGAGATERTLVNSLLAHLGEPLRGIGNAQRPGIVHRLDKDTSGLMVVAKSDPAFHGLAKQFRPPRTIFRSYLLAVMQLPRAARGGTRLKSGVIDLPIARHPIDRKKMAAGAAQGKPSLTRWRVIEELRIGYLVQATLETGRTHQIRVHFQAVGAPLIGDQTYGPALSGYPAKIRGAVKRFGRQALHAAELKFLHPVTGGELSFSSELPEDMAELVAVLRGR